MQECIVVPLLAAASLVHHVMSLSQADDVSNEHEIVQKNVAGFIVM